MIKYKDQTKENGRYYVSSGSSERELFVLDGDKLISAGVEDSQAIIDSYRDSTDLNKILQHISEEELANLYNRRGVFIDTTIFPTNIVEAKNRLRESVSLYDSLPEDIKKEVGDFNSFSQWSDEDYYRFIERHRVPQTVADDVPKEVVNNEI